jgi:hypothetical protein
VIDISAVSPINRMQNRMQNMRGDRGSEVRSERSELRESLKQRQTGPQRACAVWGLKIRSQIFHEKLLLENRAGSLYVHTLFVRIHSSKSSPVGVKFQSSISKERDIYRSRSMSSFSGRDYWGLSIRGIKR